MKRLVYLVRFGHHPLAVLVVTAFLSHFADIDFRIEIRGESHAVITGVAIHDIEVVNLVEMVFSGIGGENSCHSRIEAAAQDGRQPLLLEALLIGPLPRILEMRLVLGFVIGCIEVVHPALQAGVHDGQILVRQRHVHYDIGLESPKQLAQIGYIVGIDLRSLHPVPADCRSNGITLRFCSAGQHHVRKNRIGSNFLRHDGTYASCADNQSFTHKIYLVLRFTIINILYKNIVLFWQNKNFLYICTTKTDNSGLARMIP